MAKMPDLAVFRVQGSDWLWHPPCLESVRSAGRGRPLLGSLKRPTGLRRGFVQMEDSRRGSAEPKGSDRRAWPRVPAAALRDISALLASGTNIRLIDLSRGGALFECGSRLLPGSTVAMRLVTPDGAFVVRGCVVRSRIVRLGTGGLGYQAAISFNETLKELADEGRADPAAETAAPSSEGETAEDAAAAAEPSVADVITVTATVRQSGDDLRDIFSGNDW